MKKTCLFLCLVVWCNSFASSGASGPQTIALGKLEWHAPLQSFQSLWRSKDPSIFLNALQVKITTALTATRRFSVVERNDLSQLVNEIDFVNETGLVDTLDSENNPAWGRLKGVKFLVLGGVTEFSYDNSSAKFNGQGGSRKVLTLTLDLRIVDIETGRVVSAQPLMLSLGTSLSLNFQQDSFGAEKSLGRVRSKLLQEITGELVHRLVSDIDPITVLDTRGEEIILSYGKGLLAPGDVLLVYKLGEIYEVPGTGYTEREMIEVGRVKVFMVQNVISKAKPMKRTKVKSITPGSTCYVATGERSLSGRSTWDKLKFWKKP